MVCVFRPATTDDLIFDNIGPRDLIRFSRTCSENYGRVQSYMRRAFRINPLLARYFTDTQISTFRRLQGRTGMVISGSTAVQFFHRVRYDDADLDLYLQREFRDEVMTWLVDAGYTLSEPSEIYSDEDEDEDDGDDDDESDEDGDNESGGNDLQSSGSRSRRALPLIYEPSRHPKPFQVYTFLGPDGIQKIQLVMAYNCPLETILNFHSTNVMNLITSDTAYSFFPNASFVEDRAVSLGGMHLHFRSAQRKYQRRGWVIQSNVSFREILDTESEFGAAVRFVGDNKCWTIPLGNELNRPFLYAPEASSWRIEHDVHRQLLFRFNILQSDCFRYTCLVDDLDGHLHAHLHDGFGREHGGKTDSRFLSIYHDDELANLVKWYRCHDSERETCYFSWAKLHYPGV
ncbi:hypothetical protein BDN70DRAFT_860277 [Pholiota conissans]|uniref:Uncharacterized protein n=1 Tax=Pholiota conissans TaxID=109636 RepID=A0A9P6CZD0_9AGAR|nr:hypothetical protein BDN70DRAFT_860277 [Pholiota conissans]